MTKPRPDQPGRWRKGSPRIIEAVEQAERDHYTRWFMAGRFECICGAPMTNGTTEAHDAHRHVEVARAAEAAALGAIAGDWLIERTYGLSDEGLKGWPEIDANAYRCAIEDAQSVLRERVDELTDETGEQ